MATPITPSSAPTVVQASGYLALTTALAAIVTAFFPGLHVAAFALAAATALGGIVVLVSIVRGKGSILSRLEAAVAELATLVEQVVSVLPKAVHKAPDAPAATEPVAATPESDPSVTPSGESPAQAA